MASTAELLRQARAQLAAQQDRIATLEARLPSCNCESNQVCPKCGKRDAPTDNQLYHFGSLHGTTDSTRYFVDGTEVTGYVTVERPGPSPAWHELQEGEHIHTGDVYWSAVEGMWSKIRYLTSQSYQEKGWSKGVFRLQIPDYVHATHHDKIRALALAGWELVEGSMLAGDNQQLVYSYMASDSSIPATVWLADNLGNMDNPSYCAAGERNNGGRPRYVWRQVKLHTP